ncbi:DHA2 family efflux MFS transporter permease subunit [Streptacidiphilus sp. N1-3]|uniref:DHA2 family efflux MFS transporter permease subunit n=1 Tax=Streptacidiphilus alkalitolerans TaxID=3342712 RepID=A0ABV6X1N5_9ACTN
MDRSPRRWLALAALTLAVLIVALDGTVINVALPTLSAELGADSAQLQWIGGGYLLALSVAMLPVGLLGDRYGHKRLLLAGVGLFGVASLVGASVHSTGAVIAVRAVLGLGAAMILPLSMAVLPRIFDQEELPRAIGVWTAATALGMPVGPVVGGWLLNHFWWGSVFLFNVPVAALALAAGLWLLPADPSRGSVGANPRAPFDSLGTLLGVLGITALVYGTIQAAGQGWGDPVVLSTLGAGVLLLAVFLRHERRFAHPLVDLGLFADARFRWGAVIAVFVNFAVMGILFVVPQYLEAVLGNDAFGTGLRVLPLIVGLMLSAAVSEALVPRLGVRVVVPAGLLLLAGGAFLGGTAGTGDGYGFTALWLSLTGLGFGVAVVPATSMVIQSLPSERTGAGTSLLETVQQLGSVLGVAALGTLLSLGYHARLHLGGLPADAAHSARESVTAAGAVAERLGDPALGTTAHAAFVHGMDLVLLFCGAVALLTALAAALRLPRRTAAPGPAAEEVPAVVAAAR